jgi:hypothetical protein
MFTTVVSNIKSKSSTVQAKTKFIIVSARDRLYQSHHQANNHPKYSHQRRAIDIQGDRSVLRCAGDLGRGQARSVSSASCCRRRRRRRVRR